MLTLGSLFDGVGTWQLSATKAGIKPVWCSEIDDFPATVSAYHFPKTKQLGDITKIDVNELEPVDIICSGSPCQSFSVAGKHTGLDGVSGIFYEFVRIVKEMQDATNGVYPKFVVWENVPGAFSSNKGEDIKAVLNAFDELGYVLDMNILDAQYMGVPQRRRRVFAVWQNVNIIQQMRTDTSFSIITQMLTEILLCILNEVLNLSEKGRKDSVWRQRKLSEDGLLKKMKLFGIVEKIKFEKLLNDWGEISRKQLQEQEKLVALSDEKDEPLHEGMTKLELIRQLDEELFGSIDTLWKNLLADLYKKEKLFTTLTETSEITDQTICTCAKILESINWLTIRLPKLSVNFYETEQLVLMARKELTKYANERQGSYTLFESMGGVQCWDDYLTMVSDQRQLLIADIRKRSEREVLPIEQGLHGGFAESEGERQEAAADVGTSIDSASGFKYRQGAKAGGIGWQNGKAPTLELSQNCAVYDMTHADEVMRPVTGDKSNCLNSRMGTGGNQVPVIHTIAIEGNGSRPSHKGNGYKETDKMYTLNTTEVHGVAYSMGHDERSAQFTPNKTDPLTASDYKDYTDVVTANKSVRRLTPTECERLQGLPDEEEFILLDLVNEKVVFLRWLEYQKSPVQYAEGKCHKKQRLAGIVGRSRLLENVLFAEKNIHSSNQRINKPVQPSVHINLEGNEQEKRNLWERLRSVLNVEKSSKFHPRNQTINSAQSIVLMNTEKEKTVLNGEMVQRSKEKAMKEEEFGTSALEQFGNEIRGLVRGAAKPIQEVAEGSLFTIFDLTEIAKSQDMLPKILSFFAQNVTHTFTLKKGRIAAISLGVKGYTDIEFNGKPAPDSKRYKAIGNGMAVPCSDFIMRRIAEVSNGQNEGHD